MQNNNKYLDINFINDYISITDILFPESSQYKVRFRSSEMTMTGEADFFFVPFFLKKAYLIAISLEIDIYRLIGLGLNLFKSSTNPQNKIWRFPIWKT